MKSDREFRGKTNQTDSADKLKRAIKLDPIKKSGKEKHSMYGKLDEDFSDEEIDSGYKKRESVLDYFDEEEE